MSTATPAKRARARLDPAIMLPPQPPKARRDLRDLQLDVDGVGYLLGPSLTGECTLELTTDGTSTVTLGVLDVQERLDAILVDEGTLLTDGARVSVDGISYVLANVSGPQARQWTLTFEDEVSWRLRQYSRYKSKSRATITRAAFVQLLADEASRQPLTRLKTFIPEIRDRQKIAKATAEDSTRGQAGRSSGFGSTAITVKKVKATAGQRDVLGKVLAEAQRLGASRRVMIATVMTVTQESTAKLLTYGDAAGPDSRGPFQQRAGWGSEQERRDPTTSTRFFLTGGRGGQPGWKQKHGSLKNAPADLEAAIVAVQVSKGGYFQWKQEATKTVDAWLGISGDTERSYGTAYLFTRGSKDGSDREDSWQATGRLAEDVGWLRWAALNTLYFVSADELRAAAPSLTIDGTESWLTARPNGEWGGAGRPTVEATMTALSERWAVLPGAVVVLTDDLGHLQGRWLVSSVRDDLRGPTTDVTIRRPVPARLEPAHETTTSSSSDSDAEPGSLREAAQKISDKKFPYTWGGGHAHCGTPDHGTGRDPGVGYDCTGSVAAALAAASLGRVKKGEPVPGSGSWSQVLKTGKGKEWTCYANATHCWVEFADGGRFDTSPQAGDTNTERGPRIRNAKRIDQARFTAYHW